MKKSILFIAALIIGLMFFTAACSPDPQIEMQENKLDCTQTHFDHVDCADCAAIPQAPNFCEGSGAMDCSAKSAAASRILMWHWLYACGLGDCAHLSDSDPLNAGMIFNQHKNAMWAAYDAAVVTAWHARVGSGHHGAVGLPWNVSSDQISDWNMTHRLWDGNVFRNLCITDADRGTYEYKSENENILKRSTATGAIKAALEALDNACGVVRD